MKDVFITGGTGYMGKRLIPLLEQKGFTVTALVRKDSESKLPKGCNIVTATPFEANLFTKQYLKMLFLFSYLGFRTPGLRKKNSSKLSILLL